MQSESTEKKWFLAQLKPNCQNIVIRNLKQQGFEHFLPLLEQTQRRQDKFVTMLRPLFPGYVFVSFDPAHGHWRAINSTYGITRLVSFTKEPAIVAPQIISELMKRCDADGKLRPPQKLKEGDAVKMTEGPFAEFVATVEKIASDQRVWVLIDLMGRSMRVAVKMDALQTA